MAKVLWWARRSGNTPTGESLVRSKVNANELLGAGFDLRGGVNHRLQAGGTGLFDMEAGKSLPENAREHG